MNIIIKVAYLNCGEVSSIIIHETYRGGCTMRNVKLKTVSISSINEFLSAVKTTLAGCKDTQIFISENLFNRLLQKNKSSIIWREDVLGSFYYCDKVEHAFLFCFRCNNESKTYQMHFVKSSTDYMHLTYFSSKGILYQQYLKGMKVILIISSDH